MLLGFGLVSILLYSVVYIVSTTTPSLAIPPKQVTPTPSPTPSPTPTTPPPTVTPTPTPTPTTPTTGKLEVQTIPQDDQLRKQGIIYTGFDSFSPDFHAEYKIDIRQDGVNVDADIQCIVLHKEVINPKVRQFISEEELTEVTDVSEFCECFLRQTPGVPGVGVIDLYCEFVGDFFLGDHILKVVAERDGAVGSEIQDLCVLAAPNCAFFPGPFIDGTQCQDFSKDEGFVFTTQAGSAPLHAADALFPFASCKAAARFQQAPRPPEPCQGCPCNFFEVPFTEECWPTGATHAFFTDVDECLIDTFGQPVRQGVQGSSCTNEHTGQPGCPNPDQVIILEPEQVNPCVSCIEEYATALNDSGITVFGGPPYICAGP
ncbi:MAG: hypothetical protein ACREOW_03090 [Thermodesulfobacteriota bacterium]